MEIFTGHKIGDWFPIKKLIPPEFLSIYIIESKKKNFTDLYSKHLIVWTIFDTEDSHVWLKKISGV